MPEIEVLHCPFCLLVYPASAARCASCGGLPLVAGEPSENDPAVDSTPLAEPVAVIDLRDPVEGQFLAEALEGEGIAARIRAVDEGGETESFRLFVEAQDEEKARAVIGQGAGDEPEEGEEDELASAGSWDDDRRRRRARLVERARMLAGYGAVKAARRALEEAVEEGGEGDDVLLVGAHILAQAGDPEAARRTYLEILQRHPGAWEAVEGLASILESAGGEEGLRRALELRQGLYERVRRHVRLGWAVVEGARAIGDEGRALEILRRLAGVNPFFREAGARLLDAWVARGGTLQSLLDAIEPDPPGFAGPFVAIARALRERGALAEAEAALRRALEIAPKSVAARHELARVLLAQVPGAGHGAREAVELLRALDEEEGGEIEIAKDLLRALQAIGDRKAAGRLAERIADRAQGRD